MKEELQQKIEDARSALADAVGELELFNSRAENNVFDSMEEAEDKVEDQLRTIAVSHCEGSYNCGNPEYTQEFMVGDVKYTGTLECEYNRHDKTYYYVECSDFTVKETD